MTGPKISSRAMRMLSVTSVKIVGSTKKPPSKPCSDGTPPPWRSVAPSCLADRDVADDLLVLRLADQRPHLRFRVERIADADLLGALGQALDEAVVDALLHEDARAVGADLAGRIEIAEHGAADGVFEIGVVEDDQRRLAAKLHRRVLHLRAGERQHLAAGRHRAGQRDLGDDRMAEPARRRHRHSPARR